MTQDHHQDTAAAVGLLDFEAELRLRDRDAVVDPFIGLQWHLLRAGHPPYVTAVRRATLRTPALANWIRATERKGIVATYRGFMDGGGAKKAPKPSNGKTRTFTDAELEALADKAAEEDSLLKSLEGEGVGQALAAEHLVEDLTRADGSPLRVMRRHCGDHAWVTGEPRCPQCHKPAVKEEWQPAAYSPAVALRIWSMTDKVAEAALEAVFGKGNTKSRGELSLTLGEALFRWVLAECERIEASMATIGEDLAKN